MLSTKIIEAADGTCPTGKVRYASEQRALEALERVTEARRARVEDRPPERDVYECDHCEGWHLTSRTPELDPEEPQKADGETWKAYAHRLERKVALQRDQLAGINALRVDAGNRAERKRIERLTFALGKAALRIEELEEDKHGLIKRLRDTL